MAARKKSKTKAKAVFTRSEHASYNDTIARLSEENPDALTADGFDSCILGVANRACQPSLVAYDREKCVLKLMKDGMSREDAEEYMAFNVEGAWMGDGTPIFVEVVR